MPSHHRLAWIALGLFVLSLVLPAVVVDEAPILWGRHHVKAYPGAMCLALGFFYLPGWLANPIMLAAGLLYGFRKYTVAAWLSLAATVSAIVALPILAHDSHARLLYPHAGYYAWLASIILFGVGSLMGARATSAATAHIGAEISSRHDCLAHRSRSVRPLPSAVSR